MKIYTRQGDDGTSGLLGGQRVSKADPRLRCTGVIDQLNASLGLAAVAAQEPFAGLLRKIQNELFVIGSHLAIPEGTAPATSVPSLKEGMVARLEQEIDAAEAQLPPLRNFILPGGSETAARLHISRTLCRRAERELVEFARSHSVPPLVLIYINRLSDWLFVHARLANHRAGVADVIWNKE